MTKTVSAWTSDAAYSISSVGRLSDVDGWTICAAVPTSVWTSGTSTYAIFVSGVIGDVDHQNSLPVRARCEVGVFEGTSATAAPVRVHRVMANDAGINAKYGVPFRGMPFQTLLLYTPAPWTSTNALTIKGRIFENGDPSWFGGSFKITDLSVLVFDLTLIGASNYVAQLFLPAGSGGLNNTLAEGFKQYWRSNRFGANGQKWLVFSAIDYEPRSFSNSSWYKTEIAPNDDWTTLNRFLGYSRWGTYARGGAPSAGHKILQCGFGFVNVTNATTVVALSGIDRHNNTGERTSLNSWGVFAVKIDEQAYITTNSATSSSVVITNNTETAYLPVEMASAFTQNIIVMANGINAWSISGVRSTRSWARMNEGTATIPKDNRMPITVTNFEEGLFHTAIGVRANSGRAVQHRFLWTRGPNDATEGPLPLEDIFGLAFDGDDGPNVSPYPAEVSGPIVSVSTGYEAPGLAALADLPFEPDAGSTCTMSFDRNELRTKAGDLITWPKFLTPRQSWSLTWTLTRANAKTLLDFFKAQSVAAFRWQPHTSQAKLPFVCLTDPQAQEDGLVVRVSVDVLELKVVGP